MYETLLREIKKMFPEWDVEAQEALARLVELVYAESIKE